MKERRAFFPKEHEYSDRQRRWQETAGRHLAGGERKRRPRSLARLLVVVLCMFVAGFFFENTVHVPAAAWVYVDIAQGVYYAPTYLRDSGRDPAGMLLTTVSEAKKMQYAPDPASRNMGYFQQPDRSMSGRILQSLGLLPPLPSRWNRDGTWNW